MSKLKRRSVAREENPVYDIKLTEKEHQAMKSGDEEQAVYKVFPELKNKIWWRSGRRLRWQHE